MFTRLTLAFAPLPFMQELLIGVRVGALLCFRGVNATSMLVQIVMGLNQGTMGHGTGHIRSGTQQKKIGGCTPQQPRIMS